MVLLPRAYEFGTHKDDGFSEKRVVQPTRCLLIKTCLDMISIFRPDQDHGCPRGFLEVT
ncbi:hypothetical protein HETIRDRAFT_162810 [Heterobasidion irregulare TC 32-1]|uniref:Uncharacterized protein n=1 Tax=Heterobasidion irregulare (strain TC 32-1) TaxID=747525 RepID=W4JRE9_HETIT|nr:uncharacterized protein HETIRDRAFT_162810 [Heterobasidion irregulare TC 32-1]ETW76039.1 hypothetical protein HETIRDRAFT_162810 [Heterobasidion irregulare TC 32-1]